MDYVNSQENAAGGGSPSPWTISINIGTRTNGFLNVMLSGYITSGGFDSISMTYGGVSLAKKVEEVGNKYVSIWYLTDPPDGTNDLVITYVCWSGGAWLNAYVVSSWYDNANQTQASVADQSNKGTGTTDPTLNITPTEDNELITAIYTSIQGTVLSVGGGENLLQEYDFGAHVAGSSYVIQTTAGQQTIDFTGNDAEWAMAVASFKSVSGPTVIYVRPASDAYDGVWTDQAGGSDLFEAVNESTPSDTDYIRSELTPNASPVVLALQAAADPSDHTNHVVRYRYCKAPSGASDVINLTVELRQGYTNEGSPGTLIASWTHNDIGTTFTLAEQTLTSGEAASITNYASLFIRMVADT